MGNPTATGQRRMMIDLTGFQTAWNEYLYVMNRPLKCLGDLLIMGVAFWLMSVFFRKAGLERKMVASLVSLGVIAAGFAFGVMFCVAVLETHGATKPDSFGTVMSERVGLESLSCKDPGSTDGRLYMERGLPSSGDYACTGRDADRVYADLTLVVDGNRAGLYDKEGNALREAD